MICGRNLSHIINKLKGGSTSTFIKQTTRKGNQMNIDEFLLSTEHRFFINEQYGSIVKIKYN